MQRVAALFLPHWSLDRVRRAERRAPPPERAHPLSPDSPSDDAFAPIQALAETEQEAACSVQRGGGWRPGARWARAARDAAIAALPPHQRPPMRELGRRSEAAEPVFKRMRPDEGGGVAGGGVVRLPLAARAAATPVDTPAPTTHPSSRRKPGSIRLSGSAPSPAEKAKDPGFCRDDEGVVEAPRILSRRTGSRSEVVAACPTALAAGIRIGMALTQARALVPELRINPADPDGDHADLERLAHSLARRWSPSVSIAGDDLLLLDLTGVAHLHGGEAAMLHRLHALLTRLGVRSRIAVADTPGAAGAFARFRAETLLRCPPGEHGAWLAPLPVEALRLESDAIDLLHRLGVDSIGQLAALPRAPLVRRFGTTIAARLDQALGRIPEPVTPVTPPEPIAVTQRFAEPIATPEAIAHWLGDLVHRLAEALAEAGQGARRIGLVADRVDGVPQRIGIGLARASRDPAHLLRLLARRIDQIEPGYGLDAMTLHLLRSEPLGALPVDERLDAETVPDLAPLIDALATRIGMARLWRMQAVESDVPERSAAALPPLDPPERAAPPMKADDVRQLDRHAPLPPWHPDWPRPIRLLRRPERLDFVVAELPDQPPRRFTWRGERHEVVRADGPERIHGEWWKRATEIHATRDYFRVEDERGRRYWLGGRGGGGGGGGGGV
ncbi:Y-family DNA polymerase, partial [Sphingomonas elodea]|uniref:Y-family DNA polymerase n=1 Tax=Sphingomonas elodea TaxID=179878 RepID=UPI000263073C